jgi:regulation of enolase protein 1 (concanavalin A-like superfamily)/DNA-directed RNA polymerase subunit RPC12/RpoP
MSEFKYACPVCGQHIKCDSSQTGSVMECPTCFQKITVPQAPATQDSKLIITGIKVGERPAPNIPEYRPVAPETKFPVAAALVLLVVLVAAATGAYFFGGKLFHSSSHWEACDVGTVGLAGAFSQTNGVLTVVGDGADIWNQADAFRYVYKTFDGDVTLTVRVVDVQNTARWAKAGLMIRQSLAPDAPYALVFVSPAAGVAFQQRTAAASPASPVLNVPNLRAPYWIRLTRRGNTFTADNSADGTTWSPMNSTTIAMDGPFDAGLVVCSHKNGTLCQATFDHLTVKVP